MSTQTQITPEQLTSLKTALDISNVCTLDALIFDKGGIRGKDAEQSVFVSTVTGFFTDNKVLCVQQPGKLKSKIATLETMGALDMSFESQSDDTISRINVNANKTKLHIIGGNINAIKVPKSINDTLNWSFTIVDDDVKNAISSLGLVANKDKKLILSSNPQGEVCFETSDEISNINVHVANNPCWINTNKPEPSKPIFAFNYAYDKILSVLKFAKSDIIVTIGERGIMQIIINEFVFSFIPKIV